MKKKALFFHKLQNDNIKCTLCPHECVLYSGKTGICRTRKNINGQLYTLAYANPCAVNIDPIEKKPLYHFLPNSKTFSIATAGCNLKCLNCQNASISQTTPLQTPNYTLFPHQIIEEATLNNCKSISYTYTDPIVFYEYTYHTAKLAHQNKLKNVIITAGYINEEPLKKLLKFVDAVNVDLKSFNNKIYKKISKVNLFPILNTLKTIKNAGIWLEITNLLIPGINDDTHTINTMCKWLIQNNFAETPIHFSRFFPTYKMKNTPPTPINTLEKAIKIAEKNGLKFIYAGNTTGHKNENTYCPNCNKKIISRENYSVQKKEKLKTCPKCKEKIPGIWEH